MCIPGYLLPLLLHWESEIGIRVGLNWDMDWELEIGNRVDGIIYLSCTALFGPRGAEGGFLCCAHTLCQAEPSVVFVN